MISQRESKGTPKVSPSVMMAPGFRGLATLGVGTISKERPVASERFRGVWERRTASVWSSSNSLRVSGSLAGVTLRLTGEVSSGAMSSGSRGVDGDRGSALELVRSRVSVLVGSSVVLDLLVRAGEEVSEPGLACGGRGGAFGGPGGFPTLLGMS